MRVAFVFILTSFIHFVEVSPSNEVRDVLEDADTSLPDPETNEVAKSPRPKVAKGEDPERKEMRLAREKAFGWMAEWVAETVFAELFPPKNETGNNGRKTRSVPDQPSFIPTISEYGAVAYGAMMGHKECRNRIICSVCKLTKAMYPSSMVAVGLADHVLPESLKSLDAVGVVKQAFLGSNYESCEAIYICDDNKSEF